MTRLRTTVSFAGWIAAAILVGFLLGRYRVESPKPLINRSPQLQGPAVTIDAKELPLGELLETISATLSDDLELDLVACASIGIDASTRVSLECTREPLGDALGKIRQGESPLPLSVSLDDGKRVGPEPALSSSDMEIQVYDLEPVLRTMANRVARLNALFPPEPAMPPMPTSAGGLFGGSYASLRDQLTSEVITVIQESISPDYWRENGGLFGSIREVGGRIVVIAFKRDHVRIAELLHDLAKTDAAGNASQPDDAK